MMLCICDQWEQKQGNIDHKLVFVSSISIALWTSNIWVYKMYNNMLSMFYFDVVTKLKNPMSNQIQQSIVYVYVKWLEDKEQDHWQLRE